MRGDCVDREILLWWRIGIGSSEKAVANTSPDKVAVDARVGAPMHTYR
jgi:hypothetical protein